MMLSTYQHDYVPPNAKRYEFLTRPRGADDHSGPQVKECECVDESKIVIPPNASKDCGGVEWTGIAPMGKLVDPRIIPTQLTQDQVDKMAFSAETDCFKLQPNRFLKILRTVYPDLYERLKVMPKEELSRRLETNRMNTTYQIDYCDMNEYPEGIYESLKTEDESKNASKLMSERGPCNEFRSNVMNELEREASAGYEISSDECQKNYKPFKTSFSDSSQTIESGSNSHWNSAPTTYRKVPTFSEYMDSISRNGCVIMRNKLHDHSKCLAKYCKHELKFTCNDMK
ncbi:uncharacterized protein LOC6613169 [Drosophila sechellia]|uniref:GM18375 n=1 Tax=Drosophila sechellia TaxID=7238 RepID=B4I2S3_DROSE|nr:uncharacterized protein LOC6613169 [Drosophila sechellia]EDW54068.1 GM18375 [Drosophila sechellia]